MAATGGNPKRPPAHPRDAALKIVRVLQEAGHVAYFAGGCVRDMLRGCADEATDYDVATDAEPSEVRRLFRRCREVGEAFGVMLVRLMGCEIEVATFRREWGYADGRHPDHVAYSDAEHDARRRDFTINGMFYDPVAEKVHDFVGGGEDIAKRVIRAIGDPNERFGEDYLRMLRAVRFAARLDYQIEPVTRAAIAAHADKLSKISRERIGAEVRMMLAARHRGKAVAMLQELSLDAPVLAEAHVGASLDCTTALAGGADHATALAAWLIDRHIEPARCEDAQALAQAVGRIKVVQHVRRWRRALVLSNEVKDALRALLQDLPSLLGWAELDVPRRKRLMACEHWPALRLLLPAVLVRCGSRGFDAVGFAAEAQALEAEGVAPTPLVDGHDLIEMGLKPGPLFKHVLHAVYDAQLAGELESAEQGKALARRMADQSGGESSGR
jgi:poly(A) polymerase